MAIKEYNVDLDVKGRVLASTVPNSTGSIVTWNSSTNVFGTRSNAQIIADLNLSSNFVPYTGATANVNLGTRSITSTGGFIGNAITATTWQTARDFTIGNTTKSVNGSGNVAWSLAEIGIPSPSDYITTNTNQTGLTGDKTTSGIWDYTNPNGLHVNAMLGRVKLGRENRDGDVSVGSSGMASVPTGTSQDYGFYLAYNAFRDSDGHWKHSRQSEVNANIFKGGHEEGGFSWGYSPNVGSSNVVFTELMKLSNTGQLQVSGVVTSQSGFSKTGATNNDVLLGSGGHRPVSDFALASDYVPYTGANQPIDFNTQDFTTGGYTNRLHSYFERINLASDLTSGGTNFKLLTNVAAAEMGSASGQTSDIIITLPITAITHWQAEIDIVRRRYRTTINVGGYGTINTEISVSGVYGDISNIIEVKFGRIGNSTVLIIKRSDSSIDRLQVNISKFYYHHGDSINLYNDKSKYKVEYIDEGDLEGFTLNGVVENSEFIRDSYLWNKGDFNPAQYVLQSSLNTQLANYATLAGTQTFTGANTFTQAIYTPAATLLGHAVNLGQLNNILDDYATETWVTQQINNISIPTVNDGQLSIATGTGLSGSVNFTANQAGNSSVTIDVANTHKLPTITEWNALPTTNTITRLRGTTSGTFTSGDLTLLEGAGIDITQSGANITITNSSPNIVQTLSQTGQVVTLSNGGGSFTLPTPNAGTVTSVAMSVPTGLSVTGSPITSSGTLALTYATGYQGYTTTEANKLAGLSNYVLPTASATVLGGIKVGSGLSINASGVLSNSAPNVTQTLGLSGNTLSLSNGGGSVNLPTYTDTITRLRGTTSGTFTSGDLTLLAGANTTITQSGANITIASTNTNTTYSAGAGLSLTGTTFANTAPNATHTGDVTGATALTIAASAVTFPKIQNIATQTFLGRATAGTGNVEALTVAQMQSLLGFSTQTLSNSTSNLIVSNTVQRAALTGDVTAAQNSNATTIAHSAVTHAKYQNIASQRILGRGSTGTGNVEELTIGDNLSLSAAGVLSATNTDTTYTAGAGLTLTGTTFSLPISHSGSGNFVSTITQTANGLTITTGTLPVVNNGAFTVQGTGSITGSGSTSANASSNTSVTLDLTNATKNQIAQGVDAYAAIPALIDGVDFQSPLNGDSIPITKKKTIVNISSPFGGGGVIHMDLLIDDAPYDGYELAINGCGEWSATIDGAIMDACGNTDSIVLGWDQGGNALFWWSEDMGMWIQAI